VKNKKRRVLPVAIALMAIIALSGVAYAYWSSSGTGTGSATVGTSELLTAAQVGGPTTGLVPNGSTHNVVVTVHNPASFSQSFAAIAITVHAATLPAGCDPLWFPVVNPTIGAPVVVGAGLTSAQYTGTIAMTDSGTNQDVCQGASITLDIAVS
jgi:hypothetical protein